MYFQEMYLQVGSRIIVKNPLYRGNGDKEEGIFITGEVVRLNENENIAKIKLDEGNERTVSLVDVMGVFLNVPEPKKSFSQKVFERGLGVIFFLIVIIIGVIGFVCLVISLPLEGLQWIRMRRSAGRIG